MRGPSPLGTIMKNDLLKASLEVLVGAAYASYVFIGLKTGRLKNLWQGWTARNEAPSAFYLTLCVSAALSALLIYSGLKIGLPLLPR
jgi:hypothetical protein